MPDIYAELKPVTTAIYAGLATRAIAQLSKEEYDVLFNDCQQRWDAFAQNCAAVYQHHTNEDLSKWTDRNREVCLPLATEEKLEAWFASEEGQAVMARTTTRFVDWLHKNADAGVPGHDRRHVMFKDVAEGLRLAEEEGITGYRTAYFLGSLMHDSGRLLEERLTGTTLTGLGSWQHPYWSVEITSGILDEESGMPQEIKNDILLAILAHQKGMTCWHFMSQAVQRGDRVGGIIGPEGLPRFIMADIVGRKDPLSLIGHAHPDLIPLPGKPLDKTLIENYAFFLRFAYDNTGQKGQDRLKKLAADNIAVILIASGCGEERAKRFALEEGREPADYTSEWRSVLNAQGLMPKKPFAENLYKRAVQIVDNLDDEFLSGLNIDLRQQLEATITRPGSNLTPEGIERLARQIDAMPEEGKVALACALKLNEQMRDLEDEADLKLLDKAANSHTYPFVRVIAHAAYEIGSDSRTLMPNRELFYSNPKRPTSGAETQPAGSIPA